MLESDKGHDLGQLGTRHLGLATITYDDLCGKGARQIGFDQVAIEQAAEYAAEDADVTLRVHQALPPQLAGESGLSQLYRDIEMPVRQVLCPHGTQRRADRRRDAGAPERRTRPEA